MEAKGEAVRAHMYPAVLRIFTGSIKPELAPVAGPGWCWSIDVGYGYSNVVIKDGRLHAAGRKTSREGSVFFAWTSKPVKRCGRRTLPVGLP
jgi:hypothetical protein